MGGAAATATRLLQVTIASGSKTTVATGLSGPGGIALSADGLSVFVTEGENPGSVTQVGGRQTGGACVGEERLLCFPRG